MTGGHIVRDAIVQGTLIILLSAAFGFTRSIISGQGFFATPSPQHNPGNLIPRITYEEAMAYLNDGAAIFIDARHGYDFQLGHIPGAINIPLSELESVEPVISSLPRTATLITYCDGQECNSSELLARALVTRGFQHVNVFFAGWNEWSQHHTNGKP